MRQLFLILITVFLLNSCNNENLSCLKRTGENSTITERLSSFNTININDNFVVSLKQSDRHSITISGGRNVISHISYDVTGNSLTISNDNRCNWIRKGEVIEIIIKFETLEELNIFFPCEVVSIDTLSLENFYIENFADIFKCNLTLNCERFEFRSHASTGDYRFSGSADYVYMYNVGNGFFFGSNLRAETMHLVHKSLGRSEINVTELLMIEEIKYGQVELRGGCPYIDYNNKDFGDRFENFGC